MSGDAKGVVVAENGERKLIFCKEGWVVADGKKAVRCQTVGQAWQLLMDPVPRKQA